MTSKAWSDVLLRAVMQNQCTPIVLEAFLHNKADINVQDEKSGFTPLHCASAWGNANMVRALLENGADENIKDKKGRTPLNVALTGMGAALIRMGLD